MTNDLVSIIVPIYNVADYLDNCISSACNQTYKNIEIILVDDGSTDKSPEICDNWAKKDHRIKVIHKENGGVSSARNAGLDVANGKYISFLDGDDEYISNTLETALDKFDDSVDLVSFGYTIVSPDKKENISFEEKTYNNISQADKLNFIAGPFFQFALGWNVWNNIFSKSVITKYKLRFPTSHNMAEDQFFCMLYYSHCNNIRVIQNQLYVYFRRDNSLTNTAKTLHKSYFGEKNKLAFLSLEHFSQYTDSSYFVKHFSLIHFLLIEREIQLEEDLRYYKSPILRKTIIDDIKAKSDYDFFIKTLVDLNKQKKYIKKHYGFVRMLEKTGRAKWLLTGHSFWYTLLVKLRKKLD